MTAHNPTHIHGCIHAHAHAHTGTSVVAVSMWPCSVREWARTYFLCIVGGPLYEAILFKYSNQKCALMLMDHLHVAIIPVMHGVSATLCVICQNKIH